LLEVEEDGEIKSDGATDPSGTVMGTMVHGLFEHDALRHAAIDQLRQRRGLAAASQRASWDRQADYDRLADAIQEHCNVAFLRQIVAI
jgi:adenosylcobyric acid synthase